MTSSRHRVALGAVHLGALVATVAVIVLGRAGLPDRVATHFGLSGRPDGTMARNVFCWFLLNVAVGIAIVGLAASWRVRGRTVLAPWSAIAAFLGWLTTGIGLWTVVTQRGLADAASARGPSAMALLAIIGAALAAALAATAAAMREPAPIIDPVITPRLGLGPHENAIWTRRLSSPWPLLVALAGIGCAAAGTAVGQWALLPTGLVLAVVGVEIHTIRVTVDRRGLAVGWGPFGLPTTRIPTARIAAASSIDVKPSQWGGWGYRGSLRFMGRAAAVIRGGPGIRLDLRDGRTFAVTIDDPANGAALINDYIARNPAT